MERKLKAIAPKIDERAAKWIADTFPTLNAGATWLLNEIPHLYAVTLHGLRERGTFSSGELKMVLDVLNGHGNLLAFGGTGLAGQHIVLSIEDSFKLYPGSYEEKWGIENASGFVDRLSKLTRWELCCLEIWAAGFWAKHKELDVDEYCAKVSL